MGQDLKRIEELERIARQLEPGAAQRRALADRVLGYAEKFLGSLGDRPAFHWTEETGAGLEEWPIEDGSIDIDTALDLIGEHVDGPRLNPASGGHLAYIPGGGLYPSSLGDYLAAVTNRYSGVYSVCPGAVRLENLLVRWMADLVGYPESAGGDLASGGSIANLTGIVTAREAHGLRGRDYEKAVVYATGQVHHCVAKALRIAGLSETPLRLVAADDRYRMRASALEEAIGEDRKAGLKPWLVVASAGTTDAGAVDPLDEIGEIAGREELWYHVDAAYGGFFLLCEEGREILRGMDRADSIVMDPHKGLFLPYGTGALLVRNRRLLTEAHAYRAHYLQDAEEEGGEDSPADNSPELTRHFRGLRLWLPLKLFGLAPFRAALEEKLLLARYFHETLSLTPGFEVGPFPDLSVVTYRYVPRRGDANEFNRRLVREVRRDGRVFLSSTTLDGTFVLRLAVLVFRTHRETIDVALEVLREKARALEEAPSGGA